ncbi:MAG: hypothetical protein HKN67_01455 [Saprospiraceae bacterium]|nr:hypothetical protein [Saprospiraceae bacterium]
MPIHGDSKYSGKKPLKDKSIALHARKVEFEHPVSGEMIQVVAPYEKKPWWDKFESN